MFKKSFLKYILVTIIFVAWGIFFIYNNSFIALDENHYFILFDDAMISMRYAWNLVHGHGLVWNPGEFVEGYTNLLMTLCMALIIWVVKSRIYSVAAVQLFGIVLITLLAVFNGAIAFQLSSNKERRSIFTFLGFLSGFGYYPLIFWSITGMETGLLAFFLTLSVFFLLKWEESKLHTWFLSMSVSLGFCFLTRNDSILFAGVLFLYALFISRNENIKKIIKLFWFPVIVFGCFVLAQEIFRISYYHDWLPNTYVLKATGLELIVRLSNGWAFIKAYMKNSVVFLILLITGIVIVRSRKIILFSSLLGISILYQFWVGGDPWNLWRIMAPTMPLAIIAILFSLDKLSQLKGKTKEFVMIITWGIIIVTLNIYYVDSITSAKSSHTQFALQHVNDALSINRITDEDATIGVFFAGTMPYFTDRVAIDFLGKSDRYIATLNPVVTDTPDEMGMTSIPGHNKYDLNYSIGYLKPTFIQDAYWGNQDMSSFARENYVRVFYQFKGVGINDMKILRDSPHVKWDNVFKVRPLQ